MRTLPPSPRGADVNRADLGAHAVILRASAGGEAAFAALEPARNSWWTQRARP